MSGYDEREQRERRELEKRAHEAQIAQTKLQAAGVAILAQQTLQEARHHEEVLREERLQTLQLERQASELKQQTWAQERHNQKMQDWEWLRLSDARARFDFFVKRGMPAVWKKLPRIALELSSLHKAQLDDHLLGALSSAASADEEYRSWDNERKSILRALEAARKTIADNRPALTKANLRTAVFGYLGASFLISAGVCFISLVADVSSSDAFSYSIYSFLALLILGLLALSGAANVKAIREDKHYAATAKEQELIPLWPGIDREWKASLAKRDYAIETARQLYARWFENTVAAARAALESPAANHELGLVLEEVVRRGEQEYPSSLRVDWTQIDDRFLEERVRNVGVFKLLMNDYLQDDLGYRLHQPPLLYKTLKNMGQSSLAESLKATILSEVAARNPKSTLANQLFKQREALWQLLHTRVQIPLAE